MQVGWYDRKICRVRDLSCGDTRIFLELEVRWLDCRNCGKVKRERSPGRRSTLVEVASHRTPATTVDHFDRSVVENQVELLTEVIDANRL